MGTERTECTPEPIKIRAENICFGYGGEEILQNLSLTVKQGEFIVLMGPSGCGKSTFLRLLSGLMQPTKGNLLIDGQTVTDASPDRGVVFQDYSLFPWLTAGENVILALKQRKEAKKKEFVHIAQSYLEQVQLGDAFDKYPGQMSGGMQQRVAIARTLALGADLLLMDEPFGALDPLTRVHLQDILIQLWRDRQQTVVFVTHDVEEAIYLADRIVVFSPGPPGGIADIQDVPFARPRNRTKLFHTSEFIQLRDYLLATMNRALLERLEQAELIAYPGGGI